ncbi:MAG: hypothetical protein FWD17_15460 [Polyangiaceae bacterium]|nr:hypothetical protein [Polyangiaceae bacterium]
MFTEAISAHRGETFDGTRERERVRLTPQEARWVRYVFCDWDAAVGVSSNFGGMVDRILRATVAHKRRHVEACENGDALQVKCSNVTPFDPNRMQAPEWWCDKPKPERDNILRAWRSIVHLCRDRPRSAVTIFALYGDMPPGMPSWGLWDKSTDPEYRRVCKYAPSSGGSAASLESMVVAARKRDDGEAVRKAILIQVGLECERLIVSATVDYRSAWNTVEP